MHIILISYRARGVQQFRRNQLKNTIANFKTYFEKNNVEYKIFISEQNDDNRFNRGLLLNCAFLESEKLFDFPKTYLHMNTDYNIDLTREFPKELVDVKGFIDLYRPNLPVLGAACAFDAESYIKINGFPNDLVGWGGDDWAIYHRILYHNINLTTPPGLFNSGFVIEEHVVFDNDWYNNNYNMELSKRNDSSDNGLNSAKYSVDEYGEFHGDNVIHYLFKL